MSLCGPVDKMSQLKKENEQLKSENLRFRSIIDNAGIPPHIDPGELVVTWRLRTHADMFSDSTALEPVSQSDTVAGQHFDPYRRQTDETAAVGSGSGANTELRMFTELLSAAELSAASSAAQIQRPTEQQNGLMPCIMPQGLLYPSNGTASMPFIGQNGQLVFMPPVPATNPASASLLQTPISCIDSSNVSSAAVVSHVSTTEMLPDLDADVPAVSSSTEDHSDRGPPDSVPEETGSVAMEPADSSVAEPSLAAETELTASADSGGQCESMSGQNSEVVSCLDGVEAISPAAEEPDEMKTDDETAVTVYRAADELSLSGQQPVPSTSGVVMQQQQGAQFVSQMSTQQQQFAGQQQPAPLGMMSMQSDASVPGSSVQGTLVLHNGQLLLVNQNQPPVASSNALAPAASNAVGSLGPTVPQNVAVSGSGTIFVNQFGPQPAAQQSAVASQMPPLGPNQTVMVNTPTGPMTLNTVPSQPNQHPSALILPNGQIVPVVTQPNLLFPPQQCTPVTGGLLIPTPANQPVVNFAPQVSTAPRMSSFTTTPMPAPVVTVAAGTVPSAGMVRGLVQQTGFNGSQSVHVGPSSILQAVPAQGHMPVLPAVSQSPANMSAGTAAVTGAPRVSSLPSTVMATMTPEGTIILTMPQTDNQQKTGGKAKKSTVPRPLMPKPCNTSAKTEGLPSSCSVSTTTLNFIAPASLPTIAPQTSAVMPVLPGATYVVANGPTVGAPNINLAPMPAITNNAPIAPLAVSVGSNIMVSQQAAGMPRTTDILAKATESIFMLSPSSGDHLSPGALCLAQSENQLQIDIDASMEHAALAAKPTKSRSRSKKKPAVPVSLAPSHVVQLTAGQADAHSILDQLGGDGDDDQSDINDFSDLIRLEPMTPKPAPSAAKETPVQNSSEQVDTVEAAESSGSVEVVEAYCPITPVEEEFIPRVQDSDDEEVVEIDLTEEPSPDPCVPSHCSDGVDNVEELEEACAAEDACVDTDTGITAEDSYVIDEEPCIDDEPPQLEKELEPGTVTPEEHEPLSSSSKTLFERLEEALMCSAAGAAGMPSTVTGSASSTAVVGKTTRKSVDSPSSNVPDIGNGSEVIGTDNGSSFTVIDRIGKVLTMEKKSRGASHKANKPQTNTYERHQDNAVEDNIKGIVDEGPVMGHNNVGEVENQINNAEITKKQNVVVDAVANNTDRHHRRSKKSKEKPLESAEKPAVSQETAEPEFIVPTNSATVLSEIDEMSEDGKHKGFALSNFLPDKLNQSNSAADLLGQSLCMATDQTAKNRPLDSSADESEQLVTDDLMVEPAETPSMMEEATQTMRKEKKKDKSKKQAHRSSSASGAAAAAGSDLPDTLTFNANELLNIVDVVENMAVETQTEKIKKSHRRKHKTSSMSNGELEVPSKKKKKSSSSLSKHGSSEAVEVCTDSTRDSQRHAKQQIEDEVACPRAAMAARNDPMDVFNFTADDIIPLDVVGCYSPYRSTTKKPADDSPQDHVTTAQLPVASSDNTSKLSVAGKSSDVEISRSYESAGHDQKEVSQAKAVPSENKENHGSSCLHVGQGSKAVDSVQTPPKKHVQVADVTSDVDTHPSDSTEMQLTEEVPSKSVSARHSNIATLARHVVPPKTHGSTPRSASKVSTQALRTRTEPDIGGSASEICRIPSPKLPARNTEPLLKPFSPVKKLSPVCTESNQPQATNSSCIDLLVDNASEPLQTHETSSCELSKAGYNTPVSCASDVGMSVVPTCQSDAIGRSQNSTPVTVASSAAQSFSSTLPSTNSVLTDFTPASSACAVSRCDSMPYAIDHTNPVRSCSRESGRTLPDTSARSCAKNVVETRDRLSGGYVDRDENISGRSSSVGSRSDSVRRHAGDTAAYEQAPLDRTYCDKYSTGEVAVRSRSSGVSCSVEAARSVSSAQDSLHCDRTVNNSSSLRSNCSQKISTSSDSRNSRSTGTSQVGGMYNAGMDCSASSKHRSSCQEDSRQRQMMEPEFFVPRAASSSSCAVQNNLATSVMEPFQYPYAPVNGTQPHSHNEMSLASIAAAEYGFARHPFSGFPSPFGFDPQSSIRAPPGPGRFSPLPHNLPSCGVDKQPHKSSTGNSLRSGQEPSSDMSKSRHHQQNLSRDSYTSGFGHCSISGTGQFLEPMPKDGMVSSRSSAHRLSSGSSSSAQSMSAGARRSRSPAVADRPSSYVGFGGLGNSLTSPPLHHPPSTMPDRQCSALASSTGFELAPSYHSPAAGTQFSPNLTSVGFDPPPLNYSSVRDCASVGMAQGHGTGGSSSKKSDKDSKQQQATLQHKSPAAQQQAPKSSSNRTSSSSSKSQKKSSGKSASQNAAGLQMYDLDATMFDSRCMTPYFGFGGGVSPNRGSLQGVQQSAADSLSYFSTNIFGGAGRPLSNAAAKTLQHHRDATNPFNPFSPAGRATANSLGGLNFQPGSHGFGMDAHMAAAAAAPMMPHAPSAPGFGFGSLFADVGGVTDQHSTISPIKFPHHGTTTQDPLHHQTSAYSGRTQHMLHDMGFNALLGGHHQHHSGAFDARAAAISSAMGPPFAGHHAAASFGMGPLNFPMHNL